MKAAGVDFILCPANVGVAGEAGKGKSIPYTAIWNFLDFPAVTFPTGLRVDPSIDVAETGYVGRSAAEDEEYKRCESTPADPCVFLSFRFTNLISR